MAKQPRATICFTEAQLQALRVEAARRGFSCLAAMLKHDALHNLTQKDAAHE